MFRTPSMITYSGVSKSYMSLSLLLRMKLATLSLVLLCAIPVYCTRYAYYQGHKLGYGCHNNKCWSYCGLSWVRLLQHYIYIISQIRIIQQHALFDSLIAFGGTQCYFSPDLLGEIANFERALSEGESLFKQPGETKFQEKI